MPGAATPRNTYTRNLFWFPAIRAGVAEAMLRINWDGNAYGEIGTPTVSKDLDETSDWSRSSCTIQIRAVSRIPEGTDPRTWPLWYHYEGTFDPLGNGQWDFNGDFESRVRRARLPQHCNVSRSLLDFAISGVDNNSWKCADVASTVPTIPDDQMAYLRGHAPGEPGAGRGARIEPWHRPRSGTTSRAAPCPASAWARPPGRARRPRDHVHVDGVAGDRGGAARGLVDGRRRPARARALARPRRFPTDCGPTPRTSTPWRRPSASPSCWPGTRWAPSWRCTPARTGRSCSATWCWSTAGWRCRYGRAPTRTRCSTRRSGRRSSG